MAIRSVALLSIALLAVISGTYASANGPIIFEISTRPWLYLLSQKYNSPNMMLRDVPVQEYQTLANEGVEVVWMMGVWHLGPYGLHIDQTNAQLLASYEQYLPGYTQADIIGSPYAITNYTVNPQIGTAQDIANLRETLHNLGMRLMLDYVPNHSAVDATWTSSNPEYYMQKPSSGSFPASWWVEWAGHDFGYGRDPYDGAWIDTVNYNYWNPATVQAMTETLVHVASMADMVRCDMSMLILNDIIEKTWGDVLAANGYQRPAQEFWATAIAAAKGKYPEFQMMAEVYIYGITPQPEDITLQNLGFDYTYDKGILDQLKANNLNDLRATVASRGNSYYHKTCHFVENHDEPRAAAVLGGDQQAFIGSVVTSTLPGARLYYFGQFKGYKDRILVQLRRALPEPTNSTVQGMYKQLLGILQDPVFHNGTWTNIETGLSGSEWRLVAWRWALGNDKRLVVINFSNTPGWGNVVVADAEGQSGDNITLHELFSGATYQRSAQTMRTTGLTVGVNAWGAQIFTY